MRPCVRGMASPSECLGSVLTLQVCTIRAVEINHVFVRIRVLNIVG